MEVADEPASPEEWDSFAESRPDACLGHAAAWIPVLRRAYGLSVLCLEARIEDGSLVGVLPLVDFRSLRGNRDLISLPFLDAAGILARDDAVRTALLDRALKELRSLRAGRLELRQSEAESAIPHPATAHRSTLVLPLVEDEDAQWKGFRAKVRNQTRKATREQVTISEAPSEALLDRFYDVYRVNMRDLGSPAHARRFFELASRTFGPRWRFVVAEREGRSIAGLVAIRFGDRVSVPWASTLRAERSRCPTNLIYWEAIRWAISQGAQAFDFGRSAPGSGTFRFKRGWGAEDRPMAWTRLDASGALVEYESSAESPILQRLSQLWTRIPAPVAHLLGPKIRRFFAE